MLNPGSTHLYSDHEIREVLSTWFRDNKSSENLHKAYSRLFLDRWGHEIYTREYIDALSSNLAKCLNPKSILLETGAGNCYLTSHLSSKLNCRYIAVDNQDASYGAIENEFELSDGTFEYEVINYKEALVKYKPDIVLCSWMPENQDWTDDFHNCDSVKKYYLIGDPMLTGHGEHTHGVVGIANYMKAGFQREEISDLSYLQWPLHEPDLIDRREICEDGVKSRSVTAVYDRAIMIF